MKRRFTILSAALALLVSLAIPMGMWGQSDYSSDYTGNITLSTEGGANASTCVISISNTNYNGIKAGTGSKAGAVMISVPSGTKYLHIHAAAWNGTNCSLTVTPEGYSDAIALTANSGIANNSPFTFNGDASTSDYYKVITFSSALTSNTELTFTATGGKRFVIWGVTSEEEGSSDVVATPTFNPAAGTYTEAQSVSINCETSGATIYYTIDGTAPTTLSSVYSSPLTISETTTVKAMAAAANYENSSVATATYNIVEPLTTMDAIFAAATEAGTTATPAVVTFNNWVVTGVKNSNAYVTDGTKGFIVYTSGHGFEVGNVLSGTASCNVQLYKGAAEITGLTSSTTGLTVTTGGTVTPVTNISIADLSGVNTGAVFSYENLTYDGNYLVDGNDNALKPFNSLYTYTFVTNKVYNVTGVFVQYDSDKEILPRSADDIEEVVVTVPSITFNPDVVNLDAAQQTIQIPFTYENIVVTNYQSFTVHYYDANGEEIQPDPETPWYIVGVTGNNDEYMLTVFVSANEGESRSAFMKVSAFDAEETVVYSNLVTINQAQYVVDYATLPFAYDGNGTGDLPNGFTVSGLGTYNSSPAMKFDGTGDYAILKFNERPGTLTFDIKGNTFSGGTFTVQTSEDGETYTDLKTYTELGDTQHESFTNLGENVRYIKWIYTRKVSGNVALGNIALAEYVAPALVASITVNPDEVNVDAEEHDGTLDLTYENLTITDMTDFDIQFCDANGDELSEEPDWIEVLVAGQDPEIGEGYVVSYYMVENEGPDARTAYFKVYAMDDETNLVYSNLVTISQAAPVAPVTGDKYVKVTSTADLTSGQYLIVYEDGGLAFDGSLETLDATSNTIEVTINDDEIGITNITTASEFTIDVTAGTIMSASGYYIGQTSDANGLASSTTTAYTNTISFDEDGNANIVSGGAYLRYNSASNQTRFRYYKSSSYTNQKAIQLYKKVGEEPATETYPLTIQGYGDDSNPGGYYLIASPLGTIKPANVPGMLSDTYDLYYFDQEGDNDGNEWINYKGGSFNLEPGTGYLYAHNSTITLNFTGTPIEGNSYEVTLTKNESARFKGWNLVGNPFTGHAYLADNRDFYTMNTSGTAFELVGAEDARHIEAAEGVFVIAKVNNEEVVFTTTAPAKTGNRLALNLSQGNNVIDRAFIRFSECRQLPKLQFNQNSTKLYIPMDAEDYAVVRAEEMGEMPVNFKAESNGTYSLNFGMDNVEFAYLHLIDNLTGNDVDLLQTPSYSFEAKTTDYESRFKLVFATGDNSNEDNFAYFSNGSFVINNEGNATLQVIDITGRIVKSESVNGCANVNVNGAAGVYMLRLVNGDNVKVQKVVVK